jgi:hypothetical protein
VKLITISDESNVLLRGLAYQQEHGTVEPEREQAEFDGWEEICTLKSRNSRRHKAILYHHQCG